MHMLLIFNHYDPVTVKAWKKKHVGSHNFNYLDSMDHYDKYLYLNCFISGLGFPTRKEKKEVSSITTSYVHCLTQGFFFVIGRCVPLVVFLYSCLPHNKCWQRVNTHIHNNGQSTCELSHEPDKAFCYLSFLFPYSQTFRRLLRGDFSQTEGWVLSAGFSIWYFNEDSTQVCDNLCFVSFS